MAHLIIPVPLKLMVCVVHIERGQGYQLPRRNAGKHRRLKLVSSTS
jgi:hypothetical protein